MYIFLWVLQALLALHTAIAARWKLFNSEQAVPTVTALPNWVWTVMISLELICAAGLVMPALAPTLGRLGRIAPQG